MELDLWEDAMAMDGPVASSPDSAADRPDQSQPRTRPAPGAGGAGDGAGAAESELPDHSTSGPPQPVELGGPRSKYDPTMTEAERLRRIAELAPNAERTVRATNWSNRSRAGTVYRDYRNEALPARFPEGVPFSYEGFPQFEQYAIATVRFEDGFVGDYETDFKKSNQLAGLSRQPRGTVWHHHEDGKTLHLLDRDLHSEVRHWGGMRVVQERNHG